MCHMIDWKGGYDKLPLEGALFYVRQGKVNVVPYDKAIVLYTFNRKKLRTN